MPNQDERYEAGRQDQTLDQHEQHLEAINGSVEKTAQEVGGLRAEVRSLREEGRQRDRVTSFRWKAMGLANAGAILALSIVSAFRGSPF